MNCGFKFKTQCFPFEPLFYFFRNIFRFRKFPSRFNKQTCALRFQVPASAQKTVSFDESLYKALFNEFSELLMTHMGHYL